MENINNDWIPRLGMEFDTVDDAWEFWVRYGRKLGFGVRKHYENKSKKDKVVTSRRFLCSKEGRRVKDKRDHLYNNHREETRVLCPVRMGVSLVRSTGKYCVHDFVDEHTHPLHLPECVHMMPSYRKITHAQANQVELAIDAGLTQKAAFSFFGKQAGGRENLGFTRLDQKNYLRTRRQRELEYGQAGSLLRYFHDKKLEDPYFISEVQLDKEEQITNIFWADGKMRIDYEIFGEVITFDTTFSTNKEYRPLGVFVGFNHHRQIVIFGAALLYDETSESFEWLFRTFLEAHNNKRPKTIFTDQAIAMEKALKIVMLDTRHALCTWHIMQNGIKHLGNSMKEGSFFLRDFNKLMYEYEDKSQFEEEWRKLLVFYKLEGNTWLDGMYDLQEKWAKCHMKTTVTLGMRSTQLSESFNSDLKDHLKCSLDVASFFTQFDRVINEKRYNERQAEYEAREKMPKLKVNTIPLLKEAAKIYTPLIFYLFQDEWEKSLAMVIKDHVETNESHEYLVASIDKEGEYKVTTNTVDQTMVCNCNKLATFGILCSHALKVLDIMGIKVLPNMYITKRWTREARDGSLETYKTVQENAKLDVPERYKELCPEVIKLAALASEFEEGYVYMKSVIRDCSKYLEEMKNKHYHQSNSESGNSPNMVDLLQNVKCLKKKASHKGGNKRHRSWTENLNGKSKRQNGRKKQGDEDVISRELGDKNKRKNGRISKENQSGQDVITSESCKMLDNNMGDTTQTEVRNLSFMQLLQGMTASSNVAVKY